MERDCLRFPDRKSRQASNDATGIQVLIGRAREFLGKVLNYFGIPNPVADVVITDQLTGCMIEVKSRSLYTKLSVNGRDYYFDRLTGKFGGTGSGC